MIIEIEKVSIQKTCKKNHKLIKYIQNSLKPMECSLEEEVPKNNQRY